MESDAGSSRKPDASAFISANLPLRAAPGRPDILIHTAGPASGLRRLVAGRNPYWAWCWSGGLALAQHLAAAPECVAGKSVLDLGAGSGLVGVAAAKAGARDVLAVEIDEDAVAAIGLNARANSVALSILHDDILDAPPPAVDVVLVGDLFYDRDVAARVVRFLDACLAAGAAAYIGDPFRAFLPRERLAFIAAYPTRDFGLRDDEEISAAVFSFVAKSG